MAGYHVTAVRQRPDLLIFQITTDSRASDQLIGANAWLTFIGKWNEKAETIQNTHEIDGATSISKRHR
jgi:hypothetical protein